MELKRAIDRVVKVCPRRKEHAAFQAIRFVPNPAGVPYVYATDGRRFASAHVDLKDFPDMLLPSGPLAAAAKDLGTLEIIEAGYGKLELRSKTSTYSLRSMDTSKFPVLPVMPEQFSPISSGDWAEVTKVFHAAGREQENPELAVVHFTPEYVEATDQTRLVRVEIPGPWDGLVPVSTFKSWPKGSVHTVFSKTHAFFRVGDELRVGVLAHNSSYPKTVSVVPKRHEGPFVLVATEIFRDAVQQGTALSELGLILLEMDSVTLGMQVRAWREGSTDDPRYEATVPVLHGKLPEPVLPGKFPEPSAVQNIMLLAGKPIEAALQKVVTPNVRLCYGTVSDPIRIESGIFSACVWQMSYS